MMRFWKEYLFRKQRELGNRFDASDLAPQFIPFWESGERIKVDIYGDILTGTVGITTGWKPVFILMRTKRSHGSSDILRHDTKIIGVKKGKAYV